MGKDETMVIEQQHFQSVTIKERWGGGTRVEGSWMMEDKVSLCDFRLSYFMLT